MSRSTQSRINKSDFGNISDYLDNVFGDDFVPGNSTNNQTLHYNNFYELPTQAQKALDIFTNPSHVISFLLCILGIVANGISIMAVANSRQKLTVHLKLIISLCVSDGLMLIAYLFYYIMYIISSWYECISITIRLTTDLSLLATLLNLLVMALDHYGAIMKPLHYRYKMTKVRGNCVVLAVWAISSSGCLTEIVIGLCSRTDQRESLCRVITYGNFHLEVFIIGLIFIVLIGIGLIYARIYLRVRKVMPRRERASNENDSGSIKALMTTMLFVGTFVLFWTPIGILNVSMYIISKTDEAYIRQNLKSITTTRDILYALLLMNALADPIIYAIRLPSIKNGFVALFPTSSHSSVIKGDKTTTYV